MVVGLSLPPDFPEPAYDLVSDASRRWLKRTNRGSNPPTVMYEFIGSWNAVAYRFLTCHESSESFTRSIAGRPQSHREWFEAERELFNFFFNGLSAIESFYYATYCLAAMLDAAQFSVDREEDRKRDVLNQSGVSKLSRAFPGNEVSAALEVMIGSTDYTEWGTIRNVLTHRTHPPRNYFITIGMEPTEVRIESRLSEIGTLDTSTTERRRNWLAAQLGELIVSAGKFAAKSFL